MARWAIDAGHGPVVGRGRSTATGVRGPVFGTKESDVTWQIASRLASQLGTEAVLTRKERDNPSFGERATVARDAGAKTFVSLHANGGQAGRRGSEVYVHSRANAASLNLGRQIQRELSRLGHPEHGVGRGEFAVLTPESLGSNVAACLVEVDYLGDPNGERRLTDPREIDHIARALARALSNQPRLGRRGSSAARGLDNIPPPTFDASDPAGWLRNLVDWMVHFQKFAIGITDGSVFPHSAICRIDGVDAGGPFLGSGFYVSPSRVVTAGHVVDGAISLRVRAGYTRGAALTDSTILDQRFVHLHPSRVAGIHDFDLAVIEVPQGPPDGRFFATEEQRQSFVGGITECGYAADEQDPEIQHCDTGSIVEVLDETYTVDTQDRHGTSGGPIFYLDSGLNPVATGFDVAGWRVGGTPASDRNVNIGVRLTDAKIAWIWSNGWSVYFDFDSPTLRADASTTATLTQIVAHLNAHPGVRVTIEGHASPEGDAAHNDTLSRQRAQAVADRLRTAGVGGRIQNTTGLGETFGAAHSAPEFEQDRRVVVRPVP